MMKNILFPSEEKRTLAWYLSAEEYVADNIGEGCFLWTSPPTVIYGRNQDVEAEVNLAYCRDHSIDVVRRKSGGGCVYSDEGNLMVSCVFSDTDVERCFARYLACLVSAVKRLGLPAASSEHNDVMVGDRKISGNACFVKGRSSIVHGTLLVDMDFNTLQNAITPSREKLASHGVKSVRQRVASLRELGVRAEMDDIKAVLLSCFCDGVQVLDSAALPEIENICKGYVSLF